MSNLPHPGDWNREAQNRAQQAKPPWYRSTRFWVPAVLVAIIAVVVIVAWVSNSSNDDDPNEILPSSTPNATTQPNNPTPSSTSDATTGGAGNGTATSSSSPTGTGGTPTGTGGRTGTDAAGRGSDADVITGQAGKTLNVGGLSVTATQVGIGALSSAEDSYCSDVTIRNDSGSPVEIELTDWSLTVTAAQTTAPTATGRNSLADSRLEPSATADGAVCFQEARGQGGEYTLTYAPGQDGGPKAQWLND